MSTSEQNIPGPIQGQTRLLLSLGFGGLLLLLAFLGLSAISFFSRVENQQAQIRKDYVERDGTLGRLRGDIYLSGTYMRDYLLDTSTLSGPATGNETHEAKFSAEWQAILGALALYRGILHQEERPVFDQLNRELLDYHDQLQRTFAWTVDDRRARGAGFVQEQVLPRRMTAIGLVDRLHEASDRQLEISSRAIGETFASFRLKLVVLLIATGAIGLLLAGFTMAWLLSLERAAASTLQEVLRTRKELHELSGQLVSVQEDERRRISRELHDEVGQVLSAMMLGLGNLRSALKTNDREEALEQVHLIEDMTERNANVVRNISLLLRPTMLDDLGLVPALRWLAREVSRTNRMEVDVSSVDELEDLPEGHRTCVYRVVQEALRNACRHSGGQRVHVSVWMTESQLRIDVQDDGKGFQPSLETGVGILGMEERVARLGGKLRVDSSPGQGTTVHFELPTVAA